MTDKQIIVDDLSCNNCLEKTRCKQQQEVKVQRIDAILSYIANEDNEKYIAELKNEIPAITRCDVVLEKQLKRKEQECKRLKWYMQEIRMQELSHLDIEWDEYETHCIDTEYTNIINLVEEALEERSPEDCRYGK